ncbi:MAG: hypothetical protein JRI22_20570 [Deltaproteobacteria bacterium]|nr:hypothetical protein [Deltaproteobacteria bacterium]
MKKERPKEKIMGSVLLFLFIRRIGASMAGSIQTPNVWWYNKKRAEELMAGKKVTLLRSEGEK